MHAALFRREGVPLFPYANFVGAMKPASLVLLSAAGMLCHLLSANFAVAQDAKEKGQDRSGQARRR